MLYILKLDNSSELGLCSKYFNYVNYNRCKKNK